MKNKTVLRKIYQTEFEKNKGNALQACIASIFDKAIDEVPNFIELPNYADGISDFVQQNFQLTFVKINLPNGVLDFEVKHNPLILAAGKSPRGNFKHVVVGCIVGKTIELAHDPFPNGEGIEGAPAWIGMFVKT